MVEEIGTATLQPLPEVAGAEGIEPPLAVLETAGLPLTDAPQLECSTSVYFISRCSVCLRSRGEYFISSSRSVCLRLFLVVV